MGEQKELEKELTEQLKKRKWRKWSLTAVLLAVVLYAVMTITIEDKNAKLPDGQTNLNAEPVSVTISIRCDTLSEDMSKLENLEIADYIPKDGCVLATTTYRGTTDNTVFDALNTVCRNNDIQLEFSFSPVYESYYIEGINFLYEFDGGNLSGWMYKVNDWFPNYGCSSYYLRDGDVIEWVYTCNLGEDVGDNSMSLDYGK